MRNIISYIISRGVSHLWIGLIDFRFLVILCDFKVILIFYEFKIILNNFILYFKNFVWFQMILSDFNLIS